MYSRFTSVPCLQPPVPVFLALLLCVAAARAGVVTRDDLLCSICIDIVTDIDSWLTSDTTEDQVVQWMYGICEVRTTTPGSDV